MYRYRRYEFAELCRRPPRPPAKDRTTSRNTIQTPARTPCRVPCVCRSRPSPPAITVALLPEAAALFGELPARRHARQSSGSPQCLSIGAGLDQLARQTLSTFPVRRVALVCHSIEWSAGNSSQVGSQHSHTFSRRNVFRPPLRPVLDDSEAKRLR